jgi:hypothetical protein
LGLSPDGDVLYTGCTSDTAVANTLKSAAYGYVVSSFGKSRNSCTQSYDTCVQKCDDFMAVSTVVGVASSLVSIARAFIAKLA